MTDLFPETKPPRKKPRVLMHYIDGGIGDDFGTVHCAQFKCKKCGTVSEWLGFDTFTEIKRGISCDKCNLFSREQIEIAENNSKSMTDFERNGVRESISGKPDRPTDTKEKA